MRTEFGQRKGLREKFEDFIATFDGCENIDVLLKGAPHEGLKRADYLFAGRSIIVEQKTLEFDPVDKPQQFIEKLRKERRVIVYGTVSTDFIFSKMSDGELQKGRMFDFLTRQLDTDVAAADKQTRDTRTIFNIPDAVGVLVILNENAKTLTPDVMRYGIQRPYTKRQVDGSWRYPHNIGVIVISEVHSLTDERGATLLPIMHFSRTGPESENIFTPFYHWLAELWARYNGVPLIQSTHEELFKAR